MKVSEVPIHFALVGCGRIARVHAQQLHADGRGQIVALADENRTAAEDLQRELIPAAEIFDDLETMLDNAHVDAVIVCTPTKLHYDQALCCLERGLHLMCEKPLADTRDRIAHLVNLSKESKCHFSVAYQRRHYATYRTLRREVRSGRWGKVSAIASHNYEDWQKWIGDTWRDDPKLNPGGFVGDAGSHKIDTIFYVTGLQPIDVFARCWNRGSNVEVVASVSATLSGNIPLSIDFVGNAQKLGEAMYVHCAKADLIIRDGKLWISRSSGDIEPFDDLEPNSNPNVAFLDLLSGKSENLAPPECALPVFDFTQAILDSSKSGQNVKLE